MSRPASCPDDDVLRWREFRQAQWLLGIGLAAVLAGQIFLCVTVKGVHRDMLSAFGGLRVEMQAMRAEMQAMRTDMECSTPR